MDLLIVAVGLVMASVGVEAESFWLALTGVVTAYFGLVCVVTDY